MLTVKEYLLAAGLDADQNRIKLVKHVDQAPNYLIRNIISTGAFDDFQSSQTEKVHPFKNCDVIISFIGLANNQAEFWGVYRVGNHRPLRKSDLIGMDEGLKNLKKRTKKSLIWYELTEVNLFRELRQRLIVQWRSTRGWVQGKDLEIYEILPRVKTLPFPGYQDVLLSFTELKHIYDNPRAHKDWKAALEVNAGIYRIVDMSTGEIYIGSAYGHEGIWGRWSKYAKTGHGGNKLLKGRDPNNFQLSIVRTVSRSMSERDVVRIEAIEKIKHGSRVHGLNDN